MTGGKGESPNCVRLTTYCNSESVHIALKAFESIRDDLAHLYALSYYPASNPNRGWRTITVKLDRKSVV